MKRVLLAVLLLALLALPAAAASPVKVLVNGAPVAGAAMVESGRVLMPADTLLSGLGLHTRWFPASQRLLAAGGAHRLTLQPGRLDQGMDVPPRLVDGQLYIPVRSVAEAVGATVTWDETTQTVSVSMAPVAPAAPVGRFAPIILVNGLNGDRHSWEWDSGDSLFDYLVKDGGFVEGKDLYRFEWDSTSAGATFSGAAPGLGALIDRTLGDALAAGYPDAKVTLVGHSAGGVLIRYWAAADPDFAAKVATVVTVGSPNLGAAGAAEYGAQNGWPLTKLMEPDVQAQFNRDHPEGWFPGVPFILVAHPQDEMVKPESALGHPATVDLLAGLLKESAPGAGYTVKQREAVTLMLGHGWPGGAPADDVHFGLIRDNWREWFTPVSSNMVRPLTH